MNSSRNIMHAKINHRCFSRIVVFTAVFVSGFYCTQNAMAQEQWEKEGEGEIKDVEIEIVKDRQITLPHAVRNFEKVPPRAFEPIKPAITYEFRNFRFTTPDYKPVVRPLKLKQEELSKIYGNYLSAGFGNYTSLFLEGGLTTKRDKNKYAGAHLYSRNYGSGPVDDKNSGSSDTRIQLFGKHTGSGVTTSGNAGYENRGTYFYGYNPVIEVDRSRIKQKYSIYNLEASIENTQPGDNNYLFKAGYSYLKDHYNASEGELSFLFNSTYKIGNGKLIFNTDYFLINRKDSLVSGTSRHLLRFKPSYQFTPAENLVLTAGLNLALQNYQFPDSKDFNIYPQLKAQYRLSSSFEVYGMLTGDIDKVNLHTLSAENLWINSNIQIFHTNRAFEFLGGLSGPIGRKMVVHGGISFATLKNFYNYVNVRDNLNPSGQSVGIAFDKFNVVYDRATNRINPFAEITFAQAETFRMMVRGDYYQYDTDVLAEAWHRPTYRINANARYNLYEKISLEAGLIAQGGMKALDPVSGGIILLDPATDLNMKARYFVSRQFSAFLQFNNILSSKYPMFLSYPVRGFQVLGGVSWSF